MLELIRREKEVAVQPGPLCTPVVPAPAVGPGLLQLVQASLGLARCRAAQV